MSPEELRNASNFLIDLRDLCGEYGFCFAWSDGMMYVVDSGKGVGPTRLQVDCKTLEVYV